MTAYSLLCNVHDMYNNVPYIICIQGIIYCSKLLSDTHEETKKGAWVIINK